MYLVLSLGRQCLVVLLIWFGVNWAFIKMTFFVFYFEHTNATNQNSIVFLTTYFLIFVFVFVVCVLFLIERAIKKNPGEITGGNVINTFSSLLIYCKETQDNFVYLHSFLWPKLSIYLPISFLISSPVTITHSFARTFSFSVQHFTP